MSTFVCSICGREPKPTSTIGIRICGCAFVSEGVPDWHKASLTPNKIAASLLSPVTENAREDAFYDKIEDDITANLDPSKPRLGG